MPTAVKKTVKFVGYASLLWLFMAIATPLLLKAIPWAASTLLRVGDNSNKISEFNTEIVDTREELEAAKRSLVKFNIEVSLLLGKMKNMNQAIEGISKTSASQLNTVHSELSVIHKELAVQDARLEAIEIKCRHLPP